MKKILTLIFLFALSVSVNSQTKYLIYFKDKGVSPNNSLQKSSALFKLAEKELSQRAIERRKQVMGEDNYITFEDIPLNDNYLHQIETLGIKIENKLKWFNAVSAYLTDGQLNSIKSLSSVQKIEKVRVFHSKNDESKLNESPVTKSIGIPNTVSSVTGLDYGLSFTQNNLSDIPTIHDLGINGTGVYVGILDDGFSWQSFTALKNRTVLREYDYVEKDNNAQGYLYYGIFHGASVFCLMAGYDPGNAIGPAYGAKFFLAKTEDSSTGLQDKHYEEDNYAAALQDMESAGVDITSSSLGYTEFIYPEASYSYADMNGNTTIVARAANLAFDRGVSTFTAAGNDGSSYWGVGNGGIDSPGDALNIITVGAVTSNNLMAGFSSRGPTSDGRIKPEVVAMGSGNYIALSNGVSYGTGSGTSFATPITSGIAALLKSAWPHLTNVQIRKIFLECGDNTASPNNDRGWGLISAKRVISFPNLSKTNSTFTLNKIFIDANGVNPSTVMLNYQIGGSSLQIVPINYDGILKYNYAFPISNNGDSVKFYFSYKLNDGSLVKEPSIGIYNFLYGDLLINYNSSQTIVEPIPTQYELGQNYPNPFNLGTKIEFQSLINIPAEIIIYNILGQKVKMLFNGVASIGKNTKRWDSKNDSGQIVPSGPYFYVLRIQGNIFSKKMILIK